MQKLKKKRDMGVQFISTIERWKRYMNAYITLPYTIILHEYIVNIYFYSKLNLMKCIYIGITVSQFNWKHNKWNEKITINFCCTSLSSNF